MNLSRRRFWSYAAPAIVLAPNIMRVSAAALDALNEPFQVWQYTSRYEWGERVGMLRAKASELAQIERDFGCIITPRAETPESRRFNRDHAWVKAGITFG